MQAKHYSLLIIGILSVGITGYLFTNDENTSSTITFPTIFSTLQELTFIKGSDKKVQAAIKFDYSNVTSTKEKKQIFFDTLRPIIARQNEVIKSRRQEILLAQSSNNVHPRITNLAEKYKVKWDNNNPNWNALLRRVDTLPQELVMAQAANESAWGASRFAQKANNLFGQWCFKKGCGLVPQERDDGENHEVKKFSSINDSVASYMHNLNTNRAYRELRKIRATHRASNRKVDAHTLANGLSRYSTRGKTYVTEIQSMIKTNKSLMRSSIKIQ